MQPSYNEKIEQHRRLSTLLDAALNCHLETFNDDSIVAPSCVSSSVVFQLIRNFAFKSDYFCLIALCRPPNRLLTVFKGFLWGPSLGAPTCDVFVFGASNFETTHFGALGSRISEDALIAKYLLWIHLFCGVLHTLPKLDLTLGLNTDNHLNSLATFKIPVVSGCSVHPSCSNRISL